MLAKEKINCAKFRKTDMVEWLHSLGFKPVRINDKEAWYISFFRQGEKTASLRVNRRMQLFIDYGDKKYSGDIIKLGCFLFNTDVIGLLKHLNSESFSFRQPEISSSQKGHEQVIKVLQVEEISKPNIISYIQSRFITIEIAKKYCKQVTYIASGKQYTSIGLLNIQNEWELRAPNSDIKLCTKKAISLIINNSDTACLFEGMFDMMTFMEMHKNYTDFDLVSLNSIELLPQALPLLINYKEVKTYFDNDSKGEESTGIVLGMGLKLALNMTKDLKGKDLNSHWVAKNTPEKDIEPNTNIEEELNRRSLGMNM